MPLTLEQFHCFAAFTVPGSCQFTQLEGGTRPTQTRAPKLIHFQDFENALFETKHQLGFKFKFSLNLINRSFIIGPRLNSNRCWNRHPSLSITSLVRSVAPLPVGASRPNLPLSTRAGPGLSPLPVSSLQVTGIVPLTRSDLEATTSSFKLLVARNFVVSLLSS